MDVELSEILMRKSIIMDFDCRFKCPFLNLSSAPIQLIEQFFGKAATDHPVPVLFLKRFSGFWSL